MPKMWFLDPATSISCWKFT